MKLLDGGVLVIRCPHVHPSPCSRVLDASEVRQRLLTDASRAQYDHLAELARIAQDPSVRWCPTPNCNTILRGGTSDAPHLVCHKCKAELCFRCSQRWHPSMSCADASAASLAELLSSPAPSSGDASASGATSSGEAIKSCPSCGMGIVRATGCNYLRCSRCTYEFCWLCMEEYTDHHFACQTNNQKTYAEQHSWHRVWCTPSLVLTIRMRVMCAYVCLLGWNLAGCPLLQMDRFSWLADDRCCGLRCSCGCGCAGVLKRGCLRVLLALVYLLLLLVALPFLLLASPYLAYRYVRDSDRRARRRELRAKNDALRQAQTELQRQAWKKKLQEEQQQQQQQQQPPSVLADAQV